MPRSLRPVRPGRAAAALAAAAAALVLAAGCGGGADTAAPAPAPAAPATDGDWVRSVMTTRYLYADRVPKTALAALDGVDDAARALELLRVNPPDRFSYLEDRARYDAYFDDGRAVGLGIASRLAGSSLAVRAVMPDSPAGRAGLRRGDRIVAIDGVDVATLAARGAISDAFGPAVAGLSLRLEIERDGVRLEQTLAKAPFPVEPILATRTLQVGDTTVGYVVLYTFTETTRAAWTAAIAGLRAQGARSLVVDLRDNAGGRLAVTAAVAGSLAPTGVAGGTFVAMRHNAARTADDAVFTLPEDPGAGTFERVAWLVSDLTCSAAEALVAGLRPYRRDVAIGTTTCGKPVGFDPQTRGSLVLNAVSFTLRDRDGIGDWFDGLAPDCAVDAEPYLPWGDPADPRLAQALRWIATGDCGSGAPKGRAPVREPLPVARGLDAETGLH